MQDSKVTVCFEAELYKIATVGLCDRCLQAYSLYDDMWQITLEIGQEENFLDHRSA